MGDKRIPTQDRMKIFDKNGFLPTFNITLSVFFSCKENFLIFLCPGLAKAFVQVQLEDNTEEVNVCS